MIGVATNNPSIPNSGSKSNPSCVPAISKTPEASSPSLASTDPLAGACFKRILVIPNCNVLMKHNDSANHHCEVGAGAGSFDRRLSHT